MTDAVTRDLPAGWQGTYDSARATAWFVDRQGESSVLFAVDRSTMKPIGIMLLSPAEENDGDVRLGYMIAENAWGRGMASELVAGLVEWSRARRDVASLIGSVARHNEASIRVLKKNGFVEQTPRCNQPTHEVDYALDLRR